MAQYTRTTDRRWHPGTIAAILAAVVVVGIVIYSYTTSDTIDRSAITSGSSTNPKDANTRQDRPTSSDPRDMQPQR